MSPLTRDLLYIGSGVALVFAVGIIVLEVGV